MDLVSAPGVEAHVLDELRIWRQPGLDWREYEQLHAHVTIRPEPSELKRMAASVVRYPVGHRVRSGTGTIGPSGGNRLQGYATKPDVILIGNKDGNDGGDYAIVRDLRISYAGAGPKQNKYAQARPCPSAN